MSRQKPQIDTNPLRSRFSVGRDDDQQTPQPAPQPAAAPAAAPAPPPDPQPEPDPPAAQPSEPSPAPPPQRGGSTGGKGSRKAASKAASRAASQTATNVATPQAGELAVRQAAQLAERQAVPHEGEQRLAFTTSQLRRRRKNPYKDLVQTGVRLPRFQREYLRTTMALSGGEEEMQQLVAEAVELLAMARGEEQLLEEAWIDEGGVPGQRDLYKPR